MSRDKQTEIHEIAKRMSDAISTETEHRYIKDERKLEAVLKENGWCKASDLAEEIFAEIEKIAKIYTFPTVKSGIVEIVKEPFWCIEPNDLAELKKKYTKGGKEQDG